MRYDLDKMNADSFELMVRSLAEKMFGVKCSQYGLGPDGQREFYFEGSKIVNDESLSGKIMGQVKFKYPITKEKDYSWIKKEIEGELNRFKEKDKEYIPDHYFFITNIVLSPVKDTGLKDKIEKYVKKNNTIIGDFRILGYDEVCALLDNNRDVATCYASYIMPGDLLHALYDKYTAEERRLLDTFRKFVEIEFREDRYSRLDQAGSVTEEKLSLEKVCIDIDVSSSEEKGKRNKFAEMVFELGNDVSGYRREQLEEKYFEGTNQKRDRFVLLGGPGQGKSTICQFISQVYRAHYLLRSECEMEDARLFLKDFENNYDYRVLCSRIPLKIVLKEYASWIEKQGGQNVSVLRYVQKKIEKITGCELAISDIERKLAEDAWIIFFDGLDEVPISSNRETVLNEISNFISIDLRNAHCDCILVATTRMQGYNDDFGKDKYLHLEVGNLSESDCKIYIKKLFDIMETQLDKREEYMEIVEEALKDSTIVRLLRTPLQATIISIIIKSGGKPPHERYTLFQQYYETMIKREKQKRVIATLNDNTDWIEDIHMRVSYQLQHESAVKTNASAEIIKDDFLEIIRDYIRENRDSYYEKDETCEDKAEDFLQIIAQRICFIVENKDERYSFPIRSMQEFFAGTYLVKEFSEQDSLCRLKEIAYLSYWRNVLLFSLGYIEIHRKTMINHIYELCREMDGGENLSSSQFTIQNYCHFGTRLSLDILLEELFKGNRQNFFIQKTLYLVGTADTDRSRLSMLSETISSKLYDCFEDRYGQGLCSLGTNEILSLLHLNLEGERRQELLQQTHEELCKMTFRDQVNVLMRTIEDISGKYEEIQCLLLDIVNQHLENDTIDQVLPFSILNMICSKKGNNMSERYYRNLMLQVLCIEDYRYAHLIRKKLNTLFQEIEDLETIKLFQGGVALEQMKTKFEISETATFYAINIFYNEEDIAPCRKLFEKYRMVFFVNLARWLVDKRYSNYYKLINSVNNKKDYLTCSYGRIVKKYLPGIDMMSEEKYESWLTEYSCYLQNLAEGNFTEIFYGKNVNNISCSISCCDDSFDKTIKERGITEEEVDKMNLNILRHMTFIARVQIECMTNYSNLNKEEYLLFQHLIEVVAKKCPKNLFDHLNVLLLVLSSKNGKKSIQKLNVDEFYDGTLQQISENGCMEENIMLIKEQGENIARCIIREILYTKKEGVLLLLLCGLMEHGVVLSRVITENDMEELMELRCEHTESILVMLLLNLCYGNQNQLSDCRERLSSYLCGKPYLYSIIKRLLLVQPIADCEQNWVWLYQTLEKDNFAGKEDKETEILNAMYQFIADKRVIISKM